MAQIDQEKCTSCGSCEAVCPGAENEAHETIKSVRYFDGRYTIDETECDGCGECFKICPVGAVIQ